MATQASSRAAPSARTSLISVNLNFGGSQAQTQPDQTAPTVSESQGRLKVSGNVTLAANGDGMVQLIPHNAWERWEVNSVVVSTTQGAAVTPVPTAAVYVNTPTPANLEGMTDSGSNDTFSGLTHVGPADVLNVVWAAGISGTVATAVVTGSTYQRRR